AVGRHARDDGVSGIQYGGAVRRYVLDDHTLHYAQVFDRADVVEAEMVAHADVGHHGDLAAVEAEAFAQDAAACRFEHGGVDHRMHQYVARAARAAAVAGVDALLA